MLPYFRAFEWKMFFGVMLVWYVVPVFGGPELMRWILGGANHGDTESPSLLHNLLMTILLACWAAAPVGCGYSVARFVKQLPQLTILFAVLIGFVLQVTRNDYFGWLGAAVWAVLSFGGAVLGFFLWRLQERGRS
jgi:hypothetical protein